MGLWFKISRLFSEAEPEIASTPAPSSAPTVPQTPAPAGHSSPSPSNDSGYSPSPNPSFGSPDAAPVGARPGKIALDPNMILQPAGSARIEAPSFVVGEIHMDNKSLDVMASMSADIAKARMRVAGGAGYLTKEMIERIEQRKAEGLKFKEQRLAAERQAARASKPTSAMPTARPAGVPSRATPVQPRQAPTMATQARIASRSTQTGRYGAYRADDDSLLFQIMYPELGVWRNPTSMQAWAVWMLSRDHGDNHFRGDGFRAIIVDGGTTTNPTVQIVADDGASLQTRCFLSEGKLSASTPTGQTANFDFGVDAPADITYDGGDGRGFDWGLDKGISASALANDWGDAPAASTSNNVSNNVSFDTAGSGSFDSNPPSGTFDFGNSGSFDSGSASGTWDDKPTPVESSSDTMSTAY